MAILKTYAKRETTKREHSALIRKQYDYHEFGARPWSFRLSRLLYSRAWISNERPSLSFDFATSWLIQNKILLPGASTLTRLISEIRDRASNRLWRRLSSLPTSKQKSTLESILEVPDGQRSTRFDRFRRGPVSISGPAFNEAIDRYQELRGFGMSELDFSHIPPVRMKSIARHASIISAYNIARMPEDKRIAILVAFVKSYETIALDEAVDVLDLLITSISGEAKKIGRKNRLRTLKDLDKSALSLARVCSILLSDGIRDEELRESIFFLISRDKISNSIDTVNELARPPGDNFHDEMIAQYGRVRRFLSRLLQHISFESVPAGTTVLEAFKYLQSEGITRKQFLEAPPIDFITKPWERLIFDKEGRITKRGYIICFLDRLQDALRRRDIFVENSDRWGDPRAKLLQGVDWETNRVQVCRSLV